MKNALGSIIASARALLRPRIFLLIIPIAAGAYMMRLEQEAQAGFSANFDSPHRNSDNKEGSVSISDGKYALDTSMIYKNVNKKALLAELDTEMLAEKNTVEAIPEVILEFLDSIAANGKFDIADPGEHCEERPITPGIDIATRKLVHFSISRHMALLSFSSVGLQHTQQVAIIKFEDNRVLDFWFSDLPATAKTKEAILRSIKDKCV